MTRPHVIAHRGASGVALEHTMEGYRRAIEMGADALEVDVVITSDGVLVCRHEHEISATTDVGMRPEFAERKVTREVPGRAPATGWFVEDLTWSELATLGTRERMPRTRPANVVTSGPPVPRLAEVLDLVARTRQERPLGLWLELKHPTYLASLGLDLVPRVLGQLAASGLEDATLECFEPTVLSRLATLTPHPLVQLLELAERRPADLAAQGDPRTFGDLAAPAALDEMAGRVHGLGVHTTYVFPVDPEGVLGEVTSLVRDAHARSLTLTAFTLRQENRFLPPALQVGTDPAAPGDLASQVRAFAAAGVDGLITDHPDVVLAALSSG